MGRAQNDDSGTLALLALMKANGKANSQRVKLGILETTQREAVRAIVVVVRVHVRRIQAQVTSVGRTRTG
ncbi:MAG: hypothetical protein LBP53_05910 [Candidatus Peribacteria bacterium]|nr:hypothetical protein [Candidatus Peribacteria bacterium]